MQFFHNLHLNPNLSKVVTVNFPWTDIAGDREKYFFKLAVLGESSIYKSSSILIMTMPVRESTIMPSIENSKVWPDHGHVSRIKD
jgi:hypothetical protein